MEKKRPTRAKTRLGVKSSCAVRSDNWKNRKKKRAMMPTNVGIHEFNINSELRGFLFSESAFILPREIMKGSVIDRMIDTKMNHFRNPFDSIYSKKSV
jgi:hypothetical protein